MSDGVLKKPVITRFSTFKRVMARQSHSTLVWVFCSSSILLFVVLLIAPKLIQSLTLESDVQTLESLRRSIDPNTIPSSSYLSSWDFTVDPCESYGGKFLGILCTIHLPNSTSRVTAIDLDASGYDGFLTPVIGNLTELTILNLGRNNFRGPIPQSITNLKKLTRLSLSKNFFTGTIPEDIGGITNLKVLDMSQNKLSGRIPFKISGLRSLTELSLSSNALSGRIPDLEGMWQLTTLDLRDNQLYGGLPRLPVNLLTLSVSGNILSGHMSPVERLQHLRILDLSNNRFSGRLSEEILALPDVFHINVSSNRLSQIEVAIFSGRDTQIEELDAHGNQLYGRLPVNLANIGSLKYIDLSHNQLYGKIPVEYGERLGRPWTSLYLQHNLLEGILPPEFINGTAKVRGSLAENCLKCPTNILLCHGGQKPASQCTRRSGERGPMSD